MRWRRRGSFEEPAPGALVRPTGSLSIPDRWGCFARPLERVLRPLVVGRRAEELARAVTARS